MTHEEHLSTFRIQIKAQGPVFVGSGNEFSKTDYIYIDSERKIYMLDTHKLFEYLASHGLADKYESFVLGGQTDMYRFLSSACGIPNTEINKMCTYSVNTAEALDGNHSLKAVKTFMRGSDGKAYIPGSSIKGAVRTALLFSMISANPPHDPGRVQLDERKKNQDYLNEKQYLNTLQYNSDKVKAYDMVCSIMQGIRISDSEPIEDRNMILARKTDLLADGQTRNVNVIRECLRPGTIVSFTMTLDETVLHGTVTAESIMKALNGFSEYYRDNYLPNFTIPDNAVGINWKDSVFIGGGAGFMSKTLTYPYFGYDEALEMVADFFIHGRQTSKHYHEEDIQIGISPHTLKYARIGDRLYPYGICEVKII